MINQVIEQLRTKLYNDSLSESLTSDNIVKLSQELNRYINFYNRCTKNYSNKDYSRSFVHSNGILNILEISKQEKLDLDRILEKQPVEIRKWNQIEIAKTLIDFIEEVYGWEAIEYIGENVPSNCIFPDTINSFDLALKNLNNIYYQNHKSIVYIGEYLPFKPEKSKVQLFCHTPHYSTAFNHGIIKGLAKKFNHPLKLSINSKDYGGQFKIDV